MSYTFEATRQSYYDLWQSMQIDAAKLASIDAVAQKIIANKQRYEGASIGHIPWQFIGCVHERESGLRFDRHLHNGDPLAARTVHVPAGRPLSGSPPFSWEQSAQDALAMRNLQAIVDWPIERMLYEFEAYNGWGYKNHLMMSPYVWSFSNHYHCGKYTEDDKLDRAYVDEQIGCAPLLARINILIAKQTGGSGEESASWISEILSKGGALS